MAFLEVYVHQDIQLHSFCALPSPKARAEYMQWPLSTKEGEVDTQFEMLAISVKIDGLSSFRFSREERKLEDEK